MLYQYKICKKYNQPEYVETRKKLIYEQCYKSLNTEKFEVQ